MPNEVNECDNSMEFLLTDLEMELSTEHIGAFQSINDELTLLRATNAETEVWLHNQNRAVEELVEQMEVKNKKISELQKQVNFLNCLESAGVDNWSGYSYAYDMLKENYPEQYAEQFGDEY